MRYLIVLEQTEEGFAVQVPDLAIVTYGGDIEAAKKATRQAIEVNLEAYQDSGQTVPESQAIEVHLENPDYQDLLFAYVEVPKPQEVAA